VEQPLQDKITRFAAAGSIDDKIYRHILHPVIEELNPALVWRINTGDQNLARVRPPMAERVLRIKVGGRLFNDNAVSRSENVQESLLRAISTKANVIRVS
jgi:hypothetical protein